MAYSKPTVVIPIPELGILAGASLHFDVEIDPAPGDTVLAFESPDSFSVRLGFLREDGTIETAEDPNQTLTGGILGVVIRLERYEIRRRRST